MRKNLLFICSLLALSIFAAVCKPRGAEEPASKPAEEPAAISEVPAEEPALPLTRSIADWAAAGAKFGENKDGTLKSADFSAVDDSPLFDPDESAEFSTLRVLRGKGTISDLLAGEAASCAELTEFLWVDASVSDSGLTRLASLAKLKKLRLNGLQGTDETPGILASFPALVELDLSGSNISDGTVGSLTGLKGLTKLNLYQTQIGNAGVKSLVPMAEQLEWLNLDNTQITDAAGEDLAKFTHLKFLHIGRTQTTDTLIDSLANLKELEKIHITRTGITEEGAARLREALPNTEVISVVQEKTE